MPTTDPYTPQQVRRWRKSVRERIALAEETIRRYPSELAYETGYARGLRTAEDILDDLFGPED